MIHAGGEVVVGFVFYGIRMRSEDRVVSFMPVPVATLGQRPHEFESIVQENHSYHS